MLGFQVHTIDKLGIYNCVLISNKKLAQLHDVEKEVSEKSGFDIKHINDDDYDRFRHPIKVVEDTPLHPWLQDSLGGVNMKIMVNIHHDQILLPFLKEI
ncbi:hypothetical protein SUGI_1035230 [Cryptomeria japonica]|nr:hypothetical protein SUGI_1035230 [Cryptomeria japonica]